MDELEAGTRIADRYRITGSLGAGGMGVVYRARDERLGRQVALKTLPKERIADGKARARLFREARAAAALEHPGIAQVFDVGEAEDGGAFLVMELVRGKSLRELMRHSAIEREEVLRVIEEVAAALDHAHAAGVIHRDVKPDNVMVRDDGRACLLDFGLAKDLSPGITDTVEGDTPTVDAEHLTKEGALIGTLSYLAPEQARGRDVGPKSDQFALATTAYEALAGRLPWDGQNAAAVLAQILIDDAPPPSSLEGTLPLQTDRVFAKALSKAPEDRYDDASAFARALSDSFDETIVDRDAARVTDQAADAQRVTGGPRTATWLSWGITGAAIVITLSIVAGLAWKYRGAWGVDPDPTPPSLARDAVIACPILVAEGVDEPSAWLGAMGADLACERMTFWLGGDPARTRSPAELLDLPRVANDDFPQDPFIEPDAIPRTMSAARALDAWLDGRVTRTPEGHFRVSLGVYTAANDQALATGEGEGQALFQAVAVATDALIASGAIPVPERIDDAIAPWIGGDDVSLALTFHYDLGYATLAGVGEREACEHLLGRRGELGPIAGEVRRICLRAGVAAAAELETPALDRTSPSGLALTATEHIDTLPEPEVRAIADMLADARRRAPHPFARATLAKGEIMIWEQLEDMDRARDLLITAARELPRDWFLRVHLVRALLRTEGAYAATRALAAWAPGTPEAWRTLALPVRDSERTVPWLRRAYESGGALPLYGIYLSDALFRDGRREEVRAIAAGYATSGSPGARLAGEYLRARIEISEALFGRAFDRMLRILNEHDQHGHFLDGDTDCMTLLMELASLLGRGPEAADPLAQRFVLEDRLLFDQPYYELSSIALCMRASPEVARPCLARLREIREARAARAGRSVPAAALLAGAEHYLDEDYEGAAREWRPLVRSGNTLLFADAFERAGEDALVERLEERQLGLSGFAGAHPAHVRAAQRAARTRDFARAREFALRVVSAWGGADVEVPAVDPMRALLEALPDPAP